MFTNPTYTKKITNPVDFTDTPASNAAARKQLQDMFDLALSNLTTLINELESVTTNSSGADNIGSAAISGVEKSVGVSAVTIRDQMVAIKAIADLAAAANLTPGSINNSNMFAAGVIALAAMAANSVDSDQYVDGSIDHAHLSTDCVDGSNIEDDSIDSEHYVAGSIDTEHYAPGSVDETALKANAVTVTKILDNTITKAKTNNLFTWELLYTYGALATNGGTFTNINLAGYNEALFILIDGATRAVRGQMLIPLITTDGIPTSYVYSPFVITQETTGPIYRPRQITINSATSISYSSTADSGQEELQILVR